MSRSSQHKKNLRLEKLNGKLQHLCDRSAWTRYSLTECVTNLSAYDLTKNQLLLLGLGLSFAMPPRPEDCVDFMAALQDLESYARDIIPELKTLKGFALNGIDHLTKHVSGLPKRYLQALHELQRNKDIMILPADKGNQVVILDRSTYLSKGEEMLSDTNVYERLRKNPIQDEKAAYNKAIKEIFESMPAKAVPKRFESYLPKLPYFYLRAKIHKNPLSYRPIISQTQSITRRLSKHLSNILTPFLGTFSTAHLHNTDELKSKLQESADPSLPFLSLDVESLFTNVPIEPLLDFLRRKHS